jgi:septal ring factor EnvC (AmiA/AmiB activator)
MFTFCVGVVAALVLQSSKGRIASIPQAAPAATAPSSDLEHQLEAMSLGLAAVRQSLAELANDLGQVKQDIAGLLTGEQAIFDKISELPPRSTGASTPKVTPRPAQAPPVR